MNMAHHVPLISPIFANNIPKTMKRLTATLLLAALLLASCSPLGITREQAASIEEGMTETQVEIMYGEPYKVNVTRFNGRTQEQWVYPITLDKNAYVYLVDDTVTAVQY